MTFCMTRSTSTFTRVTFIKHNDDIYLQPVTSHKTNTDDKTKEAEIQVFVPAAGDSASGPMMIVSRSSTVSIPLSDPPMDEDTLQAA